MWLPCTFFPNKTWGATLNQKHTDCGLQQQCMGTHFEPSQHCSRCWGIQRRRRRTSRAQGLGSGSRNGHWRFVEDRTLVPGSV
jgi:hypothetical protein